MRVVLCSIGDMGIDEVHKNFEPAERKDFYKKCADLCGPELKKEFSESVTWYKKKACEHKGKTTQKRAPCSMGVIFRQRL